MRTEQYARDIMDKFKQSGEHDETWINPVNPWKDRIDLEQMCLDQERKLKKEKRRLKELQQQDKADAEQSAGDPPVLDIHKPVDTNQVSTPPKEEK